MFGFETFKFFSDFEKVYTFKINYFKMLRFQNVYFLKCSNTKIVQTKNSSDFENVRILKMFRFENYSEKSEKIKQKGKNEF